MNLTRGEPDIVPRCREALASGKSDLFFFRLDPDAFARVPSQSIDYGVMERTTHAAVVLAGGHGLVGCGARGARLHQESVSVDQDGNTLVGDVLTLDTQNSYVRTEKQLTAVVGLQNVIVVVTADAVLVADSRHDQKVKSPGGGIEAPRPHRRHCSRRAHVPGRGAGSRPWTKVIASR